MWAHGCIYLPIGSFLIQMCLYSLALCCSAHLSGSSKFRASSFLPACDAASRWKQMMFMSLGQKGLSGVETTVVGWGCGSQRNKDKLVLCLVVQLFLTLRPMDSSLPGSSVHGESPGKNLECVAITSSRGSSQPRDRTQVSRIAGGFFTIWATREAQEYWSG